MVEVIEEDKRRFNEALCNLTLANQYPIMMINQGFKVSQNLEEIRSLRDELRFGNNDQSTNDQIRQQIVALQSENVTLKQENNTPAFLTVWSGSPEELAHWRCKSTIPGTRGRPYRSNRA